MIKHNFTENLSKYLGYPLQDFLKGTDVIGTLNFLKESQYWDETKIYEYQLKKLKFIVDYSRKNVPYYENVLGKLKLSSKDINSLDDINKLPILTKEIFRKENFNLVSRVAPKNRIKVGKTGGTTGSPVVVYKDVMNRSFTWASYYRWYEWMGLNYYDSVASFWGAKTVLSLSRKKDVFEKLTNKLQNNLKINSFNLVSGKMSQIYTDINSHQPKLLKGYLSSILDFALYIEKSNINMPFLKAISTTTETLLPHNRDFLEKVFNVPIYDQYGCGEISAISYECSAHKGLHINLEHVIAEFLDNNNNNIIDKPARIIGTDLDNLIMPFIRYEIGDIATLSSDKCTCGVNQPLMKSIEGRQIDTILLDNGAKVHGVFFTDIFYELNISSSIVQRFQVVQHKAGEINFKIESNNKLDGKLLEQLKFSLCRFVKVVNIEQTLKIENEDNGKYKYIKSFIK